MRLYKRHNVWYMDERIQGKRLRKALSSDKKRAQALAEAYVLNFLQNKPYHLLHRKPYLEY